VEKRKAITFIPKREDFWFWFGMASCAWLVFGQAFHSGKKAGFLKNLNVYIQILLDDVILTSL